MWMGDERERRKGEERGRALRRGGGERKLSARSH